MANRSRMFEIAILRPLQIGMVLLAGVFLFRALWWWVGACVLGLFYVGVVGAKLHPLQSAGQLAKGPLNGPMAEVEAALPSGVKQLLLGHACTRVAILLGVVAGVVAWATFDWRWYAALLVGWAAMLLVGVILKLAFKSVITEA